MAYTDQQIRDFAHELEAKGAPSNDIAEFIRRAKSEQPVANVATTPQTSFDINKPAFSMEAPTGVGSTLAKETANIGKSALKFGKGVIDFFNPVNTVKTVAQLPGAATGYVKDVFGAAKSNAQAAQLEAQVKAKGITKAPVAPPTDLKTLQPNLTQAAYQVAAPPALQKLTGGQPYEALVSVAEDPYQLAPAFLMLKGALESDTGLAQTKVGQALDTGISKTGQAGFKVARVATAPVRWASSLANNLAKFGTSQATGLAPKTMETIIQNAKEFSPSKMNEYTRDGIAQEVLGKVEDRMSQLSETGKEYQAIRKSGEIVDVPKGTMESLLGNFGIKIKKGKVVVDAESVPMSSGDISALQNFYDLYGKTKTLTGNAFLNARKALSNMAKYDATKTDASTTLSRQLRHVYDELGKNQITGLAETDALFGPEKQLLDQIKRDYFKPNGQFKDNALTKIANLTNEGRQSILARLEQISPGVGKKIAILKAVEDIANAGGQKVGTYAKAGLGVAGLATLNLGMIVAAILAEPHIATQILRGFSKIKGIDVSGVVDKVFNTPIPKTPTSPVGLNIHASTSPTQVK